MSRICRISKFHQIKIIPNSIVIFDIDDTLIKFNNVNRQWWSNKVNQYHNDIKDYSKSNKMALRDWIEIIKSQEPLLVDENVGEFMNQLKLHNCEIVLLTARNKILHDLTLQHLSKLNLKFEKVLFSEEKGNELCNLMAKHYSNHSNIIIVDDIENNLLDMQDKIIKFNSDLQTHLYMMVT